MSKPKIKRRIGKYEVGRTIGEGTYAKVKFARNSDRKICGYQDSRQRCCLKA
ncbi:cbl-interacting protein kinase 33 [Phtheirospermum japonicum]|uniref:Cbl-interacting protein kinase 33 n=1 Tax=Phtheirospermum japonicum TaxID=374723 RepID=A0A830BH58_9LAMI|nr:cbl-interacting protein kinase 33 [Phtheirospermum japonicum]